MTFTEWYKYAYGYEWHEDFALLYAHATEAMDGYEAWCTMNEQEPVWDG